MDRRSLLTGFTALCSAGVAAVHLAVTRDHVGHWWPAGVFLLTCAGWQATWAVLVWRRSTTGLLAAGAASNALLGLLWLTTRTVGLPVGPAAGRPHDVGVADVVATTFEAGIVVLACILLATGPDATPAGTPGGTHQRTLP